MSRRSRDRKRRGRKDGAEQPDLAGSPPPPPQPPPAPPPDPPPAAADAAPKGPVPVREALGKVRPDAPPTPAGPPPEPAPERGFEMDGERWIARVAGEGAGGTGQLASAYIVAVHFLREGEPDRPLREALIPRGRFEGLFEEELAGLFGRSVEIVMPEDG